MSLLNQVQNEINTGWTKQIDSASFDMMLGVLQGYQYQYPIQSTVRELASNCLDANSEKAMALDILTNGVPVSKYYVQDNDDPLLVDSRFDATYYSPEWLSLDNKVYIDYYRRQDLERDYITFKDFGVGIGPSRILKYFNLGFSTKRLSKIPIGKFGLGGKAGLSVADFFTMETCYNGLRMRFNVYNSNFESLIPPFNLDTQKENILVIKHPTSPHQSIYAEATTEKNGTLIRIETKKHHWTEYERAIEKQLMFFPEVCFTMHSDGAKIERKFHPKILYEDDFLIITDSTYYNRPYLVLNRVNYGSINFDELELKSLSGNLGLKVLPEDIDVSPSRESILWKDNTKRQIVARLRQAATSASKVLQESLNQSDFLEWYRACLYTLSSWYSFRDSEGAATVLHTLAAIVEAKDLVFSFPGDPDIRFNHDPSKMFLGLKAVQVSAETVRIAGKLKKRLKRESIPINRIIDIPVYLRKGPSNSKLNRYLVTTHGTYAELMVGSDLDGDVSEDAENTEEKVEELSAVMLELEAKYKKGLETASKASHLFLASSIVKDYENVEIGDFEWNEEVNEEELQTEEEVKAAVLSAAERRKQEGTLLLKTLSVKSSPYGESPYNLVSVEVPFDTINSWQDPEIYYGTPADIETLTIVALICRQFSESWCCSPNYKYKSQISIPDLKRLYGYTVNGTLSTLHSFVEPSKGVKLFQIAKDKVKFVRDFQHITKFFAKVTNHTITMSDALIQWNTARQIKESLHLLDFLHNSQELFPKQHHLYSQLTSYVKTHYRNLNITLNDKEDHFTEAENQLIQHLNKIQQLQVLVHKSSSPEEVAAYVQTHWGSADIKDGYAADFNILGMLYELLDWSQSVRVLLNGNSILTGLSTAYTPYNMYGSRTLRPIPHDLLESVVDYCRNKGVL